MKLFILLILLFSLSVANSREADDSRLAIHLLDYLASDYAGAVSHGKITSASEYEEQIEFSEKILSIISNFKQKQITEKGAKLKKLIENKSDAKDVALLARSLQRDLITLSKIDFSPEVWPSIKRGASLYKMNCLRCHGQEGFGDGPDGKNLEPPPTNFHDMNRMNKISAFHSYNTIRLGVPGTAMARFDNLSDKEIWDLAFYVMSLPFNTQAFLPKKDNDSNIPLTLKEISLLSNDEIKEHFSLPSDDNTVVRSLRTHEHQISFEDYLRIAENSLKEILPAYLHGEKENAKKYAIESYLQGIEPIEPAIRTNRPELINSVESSMGEIRRLIALDHHENDLKNEILKMQNLIGEIKQTLADKKISFTVAMLGTFAIVLREGFEATLLLVTLLSVVGAMKNKKALLYTHYGWISAIFIGFIMWFASGELINMSGASREMLEAMIALFAVVVLLYFGFWLHQKTEISKWNTFINEKIQNAIAQEKLFALFSISFMTVFREVFETVLFIRSLWFQTASADKSAIPLGLILSLFLIALISYFMIHYSKRIPIRQLFRISSTLMATLAVVLIGKAIHSFQEIGYLPINALPINLKFEMLGIFPVWEAVLAQGILIIFIYLLLSEKNLKKI